MYDKIKARAKEKGVSIASLERTCGLSEGNISKWNNSKPSAESLAKVCRELGLDIGELLELDEPVSKGVDS